MQSTPELGGKLWKKIIIVTAASICLIAAGSVIQISSTLKYLGVVDILSAISLPDVEKVKAPLY